MPFKKVLTFKNVSTFLTVRKLLKVTLLYQVVAQMLGNRHEASLVLDLIQLFLCEIQGELRRERVLFLRWPPTFLRGIGLFLFLVRVQNPAWLYRDWLDRGLMPESAESYAKAVWSSFGPPVFAGEKDVRPPEG